MILLGRRMTEDEAYDTYREWASDNGIEPKDFQQWKADFYSEEEPE